MIRSGGMLRVLPAAGSFLGPSAFGPSLWVHPGAGAFPYSSGYHGPAFWSGPPSSSGLLASPPAAVPAASTHQASAFQLAAAAGRHSLVSAAARPSSAPASSYSADAAAAQYANGLSRAAVRERHKYVDSTNEARDRAAAEFRDWVSRMSGSGLTLYNATPTDIEVYLEEIYLRQHSGRRVGTDGTLSCSFSAVKGVLSHLKTMFDLLDRSGPWEEGSPPRGNPCCSTAISHWRSGYEREQDALGNISVGARPVTVEKMRALVDALDHDLAALPLEDTMGRLLLLRDIAFFTFLFDSHQRGGEGAAISYQDLQLVASSGALPTPLWPLESDCASQLRSSYALELQPRRLKNRQLRVQCEAVRLETASADDAACCCVSRMADYLSAMQVAGQLIGLSAVDPVFRSVKRNGLSFGSDSFSYSAALYRLQSLLKAHNLFEGETLHSFRRGSAQAFPGTDALLQQRMNLNSTAVLGLYKDKARRVRGAPPSLLAKRGRPRKAGATEEPPPKRAELGSTPI